MHLLIIKIQGKFNHVGFFESENRASSYIIYQASSNIISIESDDYCSSYKIMEPHFYKNRTIGIYYFFKKHINPLNIPKFIAVRVSPGDNHTISGYFNSKISAIHYIREKNLNRDDCQLIIKPKKILVAIPCYFCNWLIKGVKHIEYYILENVRVQPITKITAKKILSPALPEDLANLVAKYI